MFNWEIRPNSDEGQNCAQSLFMPSANCTKKCDSLAAMFNFVAANTLSKAIYWDIFSTKDICESQKIFNNLSVHSILPLLFILTLSNSVSISCWPQRQTELGSKYTKVDGCHNLWKCTHHESIWDMGGASTN